MLGRSIHQLAVDEFAVKGGQGLPSELGIPSKSVMYLRLMLIYEEFKEVLGACGYELVKDAGLEPKGTDFEIDLVEVAKELCDLQVVTTGTFSAFGMAADPLLQIVDESNLAKVKAGVRRNALGKVLKPEGWVKPNEKIRELLGL